MHINSRSFSASPARTASPGASRTGSSETPGCAGMIEVNVTDENMANIFGLEAGFPKIDNHVVESRFRASIEKSDAVVRLERGRGNYADVSKLAGIEDVDVHGSKVAEIADCRFQIAAAPLGSRMMSERDEEIASAVPANLEVLPRLRGFRLRGLEMTRLETFIDAAFAFAISMLVIAPQQIPDNIDALLSAFTNVPAFIASIVVLGIFWRGHWLWSRRYGLEDGDLDLHQLGHDRDDPDLHLPAQSNLRLDVGAAE